MADGLLELWLYPRRTGVCRGPSCRMPLVWRQDTKDRWIPFNVPPDTIERRTDSGGRTVEIVATTDMHHRTCPDRETFSRAIAKPKEERAPCLPLE